LASPLIKQQTPGMALQALNQETDDSLAPPVPRSRLSQALRRLAGLDHNGFQHGAQDGAHYGVHHGNSHGHHHGHRHGEPNGSTDLAYTVAGDTVLVLPAGYRPLPTAEEHAQAFLNHLQSIEPLPGRWVASRSLQEELYPRFLQQVDWPAQAWSSVAQHLRGLKGVSKRQRDRRSGPDRTGPSPVEFFIPRRRAR
jgi:hypothetical protein